MVAPASPPVPELGNPTTERAIYVLGDDLVTEQVAALALSIREAGEKAPLVLLPYSDSCARCLDGARALGLQPFPRPERIRWLDEVLGRHLGRWRLRHPARLRVLAAWLGEAERFVYLDADLLVFQPFGDLFAALEYSDLVACDYQWRTGFRHVFHERPARRRGLDPDRVFNGGFWGSRRSALEPAALQAWLTSLDRDRRLFDFSSGGTAQPLLNHLALTTMSGRNLTRRSGGGEDQPTAEPGSWAGSSGFVERAGRLYDGERPLRYLHWAGYRLTPQAPYGELWRSYRDRALSITTPDATSDGASPAVSRAASAPADG